MVATVVHPGKGVRRDRAGVGTVQAEVAWGALQGVAHQAFQEAAQAGVAQAGVAHQAFQEAAQAGVAQVEVAQVEVATLALQAVALTTWELICQEIQKQTSHGIVDLQVTRTLTFMSDSPYDGLAHAPYMQPHVQQVYDDAGTCATYW